MAVFWCFFPSADPCEVFLVFTSDVFLEELLVSLLIALLVCCAMACSIVSFRAEPRCVQNRATSMGREGPSDVTPTPSV